MELELTDERNLMEFLDGAEKEVEEAKSSDPCGRPPKDKMRCEASRQRVSADGAEAGGGSNASLSGKTRGRAPTQSEAPTRRSSKRSKPSGLTTDDVRCHAGGPVTCADESLLWASWLCAKRLFPWITTGCKVHCFALRIERPDLIEFS